MTQEELLVKLGLDQSALASGLRTAMSHVKKWAGELTGYLKDKFKDVFAPVAGLFSVEKLREMGKAAIEYGKQIKLAAEETGTTTDFVQGLESAAAKLGISSQAAADSLAIMSRKIGEARMGSDEAQSAFKKWGIAIDDLGNEQIFYEIADKMKELGDPAERAAMAFDLMGKGSKEMAAGLTVGGAALKAMIEQADKLTRDEISKLEG